MQTEDVEAPPTVGSVSIVSLQEDYGAHFFSTALAALLYMSSIPPLPKHKWKLLLLISTFLSRKYQFFIALNLFPKTHTALTHQKM